MASGMTAMWMTSSTVIGISTATVQFAETATRWTSTSSRDCWTNAPTLSSLFLRHPTSPLRSVWSYKGSMTARNRCRHTVGTEQGGFCVWHLQRRGCLYPKKYGFRDIHPCRTWDRCGFYQGFYMTGNGADAACPLRGTDAWYCGWCNRREDCPGVEEHAPIYPKIRKQSQWQSQLQ